MARYVNTPVQKMQGRSGYEPKYFSEFSCSQIFSIPDSMPDVGQVLSVIIEPEVSDLYIVDTIEGLSAQGQHLTGTIAVFQIRLKQKIMYGPGDGGSFIHALENISYQSAYIVIPTVIEGTDPRILIKNRHLKPNIRVEEASAKKVSSRQVSGSVHLFIELNLMPSYEVCCCLHNDSASSEIYIYYPDGSRSMNVAVQSKGKYLKPAWCPDGQKLAYLSSEGMLCVITLKDFSTRILTNPSDFMPISSFVWTGNGKNIVFSSVVENCRELFIVNASTLEWKRLTYGNSSIKSYSPKCSSRGDIAFIRAVSNITYLYTMDMDGLECRKAADVTGIKDMDWSYDGKYLAYICSGGGKPDEIRLIDFETMEDSMLVGCDTAVQKKKIKFCPDGKSIGFIGSDMETENIVIYNMESSSCSYATSNYTGTRIGDFAWKIDGSRIFFSSNELSYYNIYSLSAGDFSLRQITNMTASDIELDCRPKR